jgi:hypothetical protein
MTAGYSGRPLIDKLGLKAGAKAAFVDAPAHYRELLGDLPQDIRLLSRPGRDMDFVHFFTASLQRLHRRVPSLKRSLGRHGMLWISWPKKSSRLPADLAERDVRAAGLAAGLVDVKICAVDEDWSALKFVYRLEDRR